MRPFACLALLLVPLSCRAGTFVYVSLAGESRIAVYRQDPDTGALTRAGGIATGSAPGALAADSSRRFLFASLRPAGKIASFRIDSETGGLTYLSTVEAGADPAYLSADRSGRFLLCAYYVADKVTVHAIGKDGRLSAEPVQTVRTAEKAHAVVPDPSGRFVFVPHTGGEAIFQFRFDAHKGRLHPNDPPKRSTARGTGPRHLVFHPALPVAYVVNEQGGSVTVYQFETAAGTLARLETLSTLPGDFKGANACANIEVHPSGKFVYASNRGHDSIAVFSADPRTGRLTSNGQVPTERTPRQFAIDPAGRFLYAAGESSGKLAAYRIDPRGGGLKRLGTYGAGKQPWWVLVVEVPGK